MIKFVQRLGIDQNDICQTQERPVRIGIIDGIIGHILVFSSKSETLRIGGIVIIDAVGKDPGRVFDPIAGKVSTGRHDRIFIVIGIIETGVRLTLCIVAPAVAYTFGDAVVIVVEEVVPMTCAAGPAAGLNEVRTRCGHVALILCMHRGLVGSIAGDGIDGKQELRGIGVGFEPKLVVFRELIVAVRTG